MGLSERFELVRTNSDTPSILIKFIEKIIKGYKNYPLIQTLIQTFKYLQIII